MPIHKYHKSIDKQFCYWRVFISKTVFPLYFSINVLLLLFGVIIKYKDCILIGGN